MALEVTQANWKQEVLEATTPVVVDFWAPWCGPCRMQGPILEKLAAAHAEVKVVKVNVDENMELASQFQIMSIPSLLLFNKGQLVEAKVGLQSLQDLEAFIAL